jgi:hypothetical protein
VQQRRAVVNLELRVLECGGKAAAPDLAADHDPGAFPQAAVDESASEPRRLDLTRLVAQEGRRPLNSSPEGLFDTDAPHLKTSAGGSAVGDPARSRAALSSRRSS